MPGIFHKIVESGTKIATKTALTDVVKFVLPFLELLIKAKVFVPVLLLGGLGAGVYYNKLTGDIAAVIGGLVVITLLVVRFAKNKR